MNTSRSKGIQRVYVTRNIIVAHFSSALAPHLLHPCLSDSAVWQNALQLINVSEVLTTNYLKAVQCKKSVKLHGVRAIRWRHILLLRIPVRGKTGDTW